MSQAKSAEWKKFRLPGIAIIVLVLVLALSNRSGTMPNGVPIIASDEAYQDALNRVLVRTNKAVRKFNTGQELGAQDRADALWGAKTFDAMNAWRPEPAVGYYEAGFLYYLAGDTDRCSLNLTQSIYNSALPANNSSANDRFNVEGIIGDTHHLLSLIAFDRHDYQTSVKEATIALQHRIDHQQYYLARARAEVQLNQKPAAEKDLGDALKLDPNYAARRSHSKTNSWLALRLKLQRHRVDAIPNPRRFRPVRKDVPKVPPTLGAHHLDPAHPMGVVLDLGDFAGVERIEE